MLSSFFNAMADGYDISLIPRQSNSMYVCEYNTLHACVDDPKMPTKLLFMIKCLSYKPCSCHVKSCIDQKKGDEIQMRKFNHKKP